MSRSPRWILVAVAVGSVAAVLANLASAAGRAAGTLVLGVVAPLTGEVAIDGALEKQGVQLAVSQINGAGGVGGRRLVVKLEDGACDPAASASAATRLITRDRVVALEGAFCSSGTAAIMPLAARFKVPFVSATSTAADLTEKGNPWFSRFAPTEALMSRQAVPILVKRLKIKKAAILTFNDDYGISYAQANEANLKKAGVKVVSVQNFGSNTQDYSPFISKIKASGADAVFVAADTGPTAAVFKQMAQLGLTRITKVSAQVAASQQFIQLATPRAAEGIYATTPYVATSPLPRSVAFVKAYTARFGKVPEADAAGAYDAVYLLIDAIKRAGSTKPDAVQKAIRATRMQSVHGPLTFDTKGQGYTDFFLVRIAGGKIGVIAPLSTRG